ncbi:MAG: Verru_Chthon cassette protein C [Blastochloris sp.]|nr:Verru_Chthon cassette protein C [Blastochloris sp.]
MSWPIQDFKPLQRSAAGFSMVEIMVSITILSVILLATTAMIGQVNNVWRRTTGKMNAFQESRAAFESLTRKLSQSTLNTYWDYNPPIGNPGGLVPTEYVRQSELHFVCGPAKELLNGVPALTTTGHAVFFQAPLGYTVDSSSTQGRLDNLLNASGYFIQYSSDQDRRPNFIQAASGVLPKNRYRLMELWQPSSELSVYAINWDTVANPYDWFMEPVTQKQGRAIASNIIALVIQPGRSSGDTGGPLSSDFSYDSRRYLKSPANPFASLTRNQLPPVLNVTMVALDEDSAKRMDEKFGDTAPLLQADALFTEPDDLAKDLYVKEGGDTSLEAFLAENGYNYRIFVVDHHTSSQVE